MLLNGKIDDDPNSSSPNSPSRAWYIWVGISFLPVYILFSALRNAGCGTAAGCFGVAIVIAVRSSWELRTRIWFWVTVAIIALLHLAMILFIPWPNTDYRWPIVFPVGVLDILAISFVIKLVGKWIGQLKIKGSDTLPESHAN